MGSVRAQEEAAGRQEPKISENEALIESCFRRLLSSIETEREEIRRTWARIETEGDSTAADLEKLRADVEEWCHAERKEIELGWQRIDRLREQMTIQHGKEMVDAKPLEINCSGKIFHLPRAVLGNVDGSYLNFMFSDAFIEDVPRDPKGRYFLDFNPVCFGIVVDYLMAWKQRRDGVPPELPDIPPEQQMNFDLLVDTLKLQPLVRENRLNVTVGTSLRISGGTITATHRGWQVVSTLYPLNMAGAGYFEVQVLENPTAKGGIAIGVCGHIPTAAEANSLFTMKHNVLYVGGNALTGDGVAIENVEKGMVFAPGMTIGVKFDVVNRSLIWYKNRATMGTCALSLETLEHMRVLYPIFALHDPGQSIQVAFDAPVPMGGKAIHK